MSAQTKKRQTVHRNTENQIAKVCNRDVKAQNRPFFFLRLTPYNRPTINLGSWPLLYMCCPHMSIQGDDYAHLRQPITVI